MRRVLILLIAALPLLPPVTARADPGPPIGPEPLDPVIGALPAYPVPHTPYAGRICPDGAPRCIDDTIDRMRARLHGYAASCSHRAVFSLAYLRVTENVRDAIRTGWFDDRVWLAQVDAVFAHLYFRTLDRWEAGHTGRVPRAWQITLQAEDDHAMTGLGNFMLAMNAHINRDFPHALARAGLTAADGATHKPDHDAYNTRLDSLYAPVFEEEARRFDPTFDDIDVGPFEETAAGVVMRGWREVVWRHAERLVTAGTPLQRRAAEQQIEAYAAAQALMIRSMFASPHASARDHYCARRGG